MFVYGGSSTSSSKGESSLYSLDLKHYKWEIINARGEVPLSRDEHTAIIFGGIYEVTKELDDMHVFDFRNKRWITFFEEMGSPLKRNAIISRDSSPTANRKSTFGQPSSFKIDRPMTQGGGSPSPTRSIRKGYGGGNNQLSSQKVDQSVNFGLLGDSKITGSPSQQQNKRPQTTMSGGKRKRRLLGKTAEKGKEVQVIELESPTSISMKNSFIIKNADPSFDSYYNSMKKRKNNTTNSFIMGGSTEGAYGKIPGRRPAARDGHTGIIAGDLFLVFGGDRHQMPFNDIYMLDLKKEFIIRSHLLM
jgi:hypothetical protein